MSELETRRHLNLSDRRALEAAGVANFMRNYGRRAQKGVEANDRHYDRSMQRRMRRMDPQRLDALMREDED